MGNRIIGAGQRLIFHDEIQNEVISLAENISSQLTERQNESIFVCILDGAFMFYSDLMKKVLSPKKMEYAFMKVKSYRGNGTRGDVRIVKDLEHAVEGKDVYIIDDIYDSGNTAMYLEKTLKARDPKNIFTVTLLRKEGSRQKVDNLQTVFTVSKGFWVVGYGMDNNGEERGLPCIYAKPLS